MARYEEHELSALGIPRGRCDVKALEYPVPHRSRQFVAAHCLFPIDPRPDANLGSDATMRWIVVVEIKGALERSFDLPDSGELSATELDPPAFVQKRLLDALDETLRQRMTRLGVSLSDAKLSAHLHKVALELAAAV